MSSRPVVRLVNAVEPVTPLYRHLIPALVNEGYAVEVLMSKTPYRPERDSLEGALEHVDHVRILQGPRRRKGGVGRLASLVRYHLWVARHVIIGAVPALTVYLTQPPLIGWWGSVARRRRGAPFVLYSMDIYPDVAQKAGLLKDGRGTRQLSRMAATMYCSADAVVSIGRCMSRRLERMGVEEGRIALIPNWVDPEVVRPVPRDQNALLQDLGLSGKPVLLYSGNLGHSHSLKDLVDVLAKFDHLRLLVVGEGVGLPALKEQVESQCRENVHFLPFQPESRLAESLGAGDVHFVSLQPEFEGLVVPSKAYGALAAHRPILFCGPAESEIGQMVRDEGIGWVVEPGDVEALQSALHEMVDRQKLAAMAARAAKTFNGKYRSDLLVRRLVKLVNDNARNEAPPPEPETRGVR